MRLNMERESIYSHFLSLPVVILLLLCAAVACIKASRMLTASLLNPAAPRTVFAHAADWGSQRHFCSDSYRVDAELRPLVDKIIDQSQALKSN